MLVYLTGFMGAGKTTVGRALAAKQGVPFVDLDERIESEAGVSVREIFEREGEAGFRVREHRALAATLALEDAVVATGGGTLTFDINRKLIAERGLTVWLNPPFESIAGRIGGLARADRPLFRDLDQARTLFQQRLPAYQACDARIDVAAAESPEEIASRVQLLLGARA